MRGTLKFAKYPAGMYDCVVLDVQAGLSSKKEDIIIVTYEVQSGPRENETFKEKLSFISQKFLAALGEPSEINDEWDTQRWIGKPVIVEVKYSPAPEEWPRYAHFKKKTSPLKTMAPADPAQNPVKGFEEETVPF